MVVGWQTEKKNQVGALFVQDPQMTESQVQELVNKLSGKNTRSERARDQEQKAVTVSIASNQDLSLIHI